MKSRVIIVSPFMKTVKQIASTVFEDKLTLYAAQTSFYIFISAIPFVMLLMAASAHLAPELIDELVALMRGVLPESAKGLFDAICAEITEKQQIPLISTAAVTTLWSASRGLNAVMRGVAEVYKVNVKGSAVINVIRALVYTVVFIAVILATLVFLVFGGMLKNAVLSSGGLINSLLRFKSVFLFLLLTVYFTILYFIVAKGALLVPFMKRNVDEAPRKLIDNLPGAAIAALGWIIFSFFYSLYFLYFPKFSYIYGSLAAIVFMMLWVYFCIIILLAGAEFNKIRLGAKRRAEKNK